MARFWANKAREQRDIRNVQQQMRRLSYRRRRKLPPGTFIPPWVAYKEPTEEGKKELELEDLQLWTSMDMNKDGKLTIAEFERFSRSPNAQAFVRQMKAHKAVETWADKLGIDAEKAKAAMMVGANAQRRHAYQQHQYNARVNAYRRRAAIARRNQQANMARQQQANSYWSRLGINPYRQRNYYAAMQRRGAAGQRRSDEL
uniref:EF-hand domain-containing protein n=1 Tax=Ciona savignyi TaxID=51511 RepID=H2Z3F7_CIOSA